MTKFNECPNCHQKLNTMFLSNLVLKSTCFHCGHEIKVKQWITLSSVLMGIVLMMITNPYLGAFSAFVWMATTLGFRVLLTLFFGYDFKAVEVYFDEHNNPLQKDVVEEEKSYETTTTPIKDKLVYLLLIVFVGIINLLLGAYVSHALSDSRVIQGRIMSVFSTISMTYFLMLIFYVFKEKWYFVLKAEPLNNLGYWISLILVSHILTIMFDIFSLDGYRTIGRWYLPLILGIALLMFFGQKMFNKSMGKFEEEES